MRVIVPMAMIVPVGMAVRMTFTRGVGVRVHFRQVHSTRMPISAHHQLSTCYWKLDNIRLRIR